MKIFRMASIAGFALAAQASMAQTFDNGIPSNWTSVGTTGTSGANGVVTLAPGLGDTAYGYVTTAGSTATGVGYGLGSETNGSSLTSSVFTAAAGQALKFDFNFVTSDGAGQGTTYSDYGYANLLNAAGQTVAVLFNARTEPSGTIAPGSGLPTPVATLSPANVPIVSGAPNWSALGTSSGTCFGPGCGYTGWIQSSFTIASAGSYKIQFGVANWLDTAYDTGLAFDGVTIGGTSIGGGGGATAAPEIDAGSASACLTLLFGVLAIVRGRREMLVSAAG